jgi:hypothetical protein
MDQHPRRKIHSITLTRSAEAMPIEDGRRIAAILRS